MARLPAGATRGGVGEINLVGGHGRGGVGRRWSPTAFFPGFSRPLVFFGLGLIADVVRTGVPRALEIREGDHVCLVGKTLAERMQHFNRWETLLHQRFPRHRLVVCNLAWPADEVVPRPRAEGFGTPEEHLTFSKTDVVLAFFGFNESFAGPAGVAAFKKDLGEWVAATLKANYSGKGAPQLALVSPIAHENLRNPNLPDGAANNRNLELYTTAMREVAAEHGVVLGDVFHPTPKVFAENNGTPHTVIGVHLNAAGNTAFAPILDRALFGEAGLNNPSNEGLRVAIADKNFHWYHRYRIVNSYYVYGGRSGLKFADGAQTNRDQRVWTLAQDGGTCGPVDDSSVPPFLSVVTSFGLNQSKDAGAMTGQTSKTAEGESAKIARQRKR